MPVILKRQTEYISTIPFTVGKSIDDLQLVLENADIKKDQMLSEALKTHWPMQILSFYLVGVKIFTGLVIFLLLLDFRVESGLLIAPLFFIGAAAHFIEKVLPGLHEKSSQPSKLERIFSPLADRLLLLPIIFYSLVMVSRPLLFLILFAEIIHALISLMAVDKDILPKNNIFLKAKNALQFTALLGILAFWPAPANIIFVAMLAVSLIFMAIGIIFNGITISLKYEASAAENLQHSFRQKRGIEAFKKQEA